MNQLHTVIGAAGAIGQATLLALQEKNLPVRAVNRSTEMEGVPTAFADMRQADDAQRAIAGSSHVYLCLGLPYRSDVWLRDWPVVMHNAIEACAKNDALLVFLDNIYMYGPPPLPVPFDEDTPQNPNTQKGNARKQTADLLLAAIAQGKVKGVIGRSADFYGEAAVNSPFYISFLQRMLQNKPPQSLGAPHMPHTYAHAGDNGRALVMLAQASDTWGQVWHLPVGSPITFEEVAQHMNQELDTDFSVQFLPAFLRKLLALFIRPLREANAMNYQFLHPYEMDDSKFRKRFPDFQVTPYKQGIHDMVHWFRHHRKVNANL